MECWVFTFGVGQLMANYAIMLHGTYEDTRERMFEQFGTHWCGQYSVEEFEKSDSLKGLKVLEV